MCSGRAGEVDESSKREEVGVKEQMEGGRKERGRELSCQHAF